MVYNGGVKTGLQVKFGNSGKIEKADLYLDSKLLIPRDMHGS
ncbi:hypothetical protein N8603_05640 [Verrucomicrobiales bacterium]|nr:hypothetical protein [Verrucomicrobiales bacterium]